MNIFKRTIFIGLTAGILSISGHAVQAKDVLLKQGMSSNEIRNVQTRLKELGYFKTNITGYFGEVTKNAVEKYQKDNKLNPDGIVRNNTWDKLFKDSNNTQKAEADTPKTAPKEQKTTAANQSKKTSSQTSKSQTKTIFLKQGMWSSDVTKAQGRLKDLGYIQVNPTGYFGELTKEAVAKYQKDNQLPSNGTIDNNTWEKLFSNSSTGVKRVVTASRGGAIRENDPNYPNKPSNSSINNVAKKIAKVFVDIGHGGKDVGAINGTSEEKDISLSVGLKLKKLLMDKGFDVKTSRDDDTFVDLAPRSKMANQWGADIFVSVHQNAGGGDGYEVIHSIAGGDGERLANLVADEFKKTGQNPHGVGVYSKRSNDYPDKDYYAVIRESAMPAIIAEYAFLDSTDFSAIDTDDKQQAEAQALFNAICEYFNVENTSDTTEEKN